MYALQMENLATGNEYGPTKAGEDLERHKEIAREMFSMLNEEWEIRVKDEKGTNVHVIGACQERGCCAVVEFEPLHDPKGYCAGCFEIFCEEHLTDQCGCGDDGSGRGVVDLDDFYCHDCHKGRHEPPEVD